MKKEILAIFICLLSIGCSTNDENRQIVEPVGTAEYFINNNTEKDLIIIFQKSEELGSEIDTTSIIEVNTSLKILEDGIIGVNPVPENSFNEIRIYESSNWNDTLLFFSPVENEDWIVTEQDLGNKGYGLTVYEMTFIEEDLNKTGF